MFRPECVHSHSPASNMINGILEVWAIGCTEGYVEKQLNCVNGNHLGISLGNSALNDVKMNEHQQLDSALSADVTLPETTTALDVQCQVIQDSSGVPSIVRVELIGDVPNLMSFVPGTSTSLGVARFSNDAETKQRLCEEHPNVSSQINSPTNKPLRSLKRAMATIRGKYVLKRKETELKRQRKLTRKGLFFCEHCGLQSRGRTTVPLTSARECSSSRDLQGYQTSHAHQQLDSGMLRKGIKVESDRGSNDTTEQNIKKSPETVDSTSTTEMKSYLCGLCHHGFDDVEFLVDHVKFCRKDAELTFNNEVSDSAERVESEACTDEMDPNRIMESDIQLRTRSGYKALSESLKQSGKLGVDKFRSDSGKGSLKTGSSIDRSNQRRTRNMCASDQDNQQIDNKGSDAYKRLKERQKGGTEQTMGRSFQVNVPRTRSRQRATHLAENQDTVNDQDLMVNVADDLNEWLPENDENYSLKMKTDKSKLRSKLSNKCTLCHKQFSQKSSLYRHFNLVHKRIKKYECKVCHKQYQQKHNLTLHKCIGQRSLVTNSLLCIMCGKNFSSTNSLRHHERTLHAGCKQFKCPTCGRAFASAGNMREHLKAVHNGRSYLCDLCGKSFSFKNSYNRHQRFHTGAKPYKCQHCDRMFSSLNGRQVHELTHVVTEKVQCEYCGKKMKNLLCVAYHMKKHHTNEATRGFRCYRCRSKCDSNISLARHMEECQKNQHVCQYCYKTFSTNSNLNQHMKIHATMAGDESL